MTTTIIIAICTLLLFAYIFDLTSSFTRIPTIILLLLLGWGIKQLCLYYNIQMSDLSELLSVLGTIGLILIVLEGSLELELDKSKRPVIKKSFMVALAPMLLLALLAATLFHYIGNYSFKNSLMNAIPLCVISSAIAIPSVKGLSSMHKEFIIYESSLSDIMGVLFFNFLSLNEIINSDAFLHFGLDIAIIIIISFVSTLLLAFFLSKIKHHIKFGPIILMVLLIYAISKVYHLPGLVFILIFGLFLGNLDALGRFRWIEKLKPEILNKEVHKFKEIVTEASFIIRALFFILFGYMLNTAEILNAETFPFSLSIVSAIFIIRLIHLKIFKLPLLPLLFIAPRGLITILLFFAILPHHKIAIVNNSLVVQIIILTAFFMVPGLLFTKKVIK